MYEDVVGVGDYDVMGEELLGDDMLGAAPALNPALLRNLRPNLLRLPPRPAWRNQVAPGVPVPGQGLWPLPLNPSANGGVFTAAFPSINFTGVPQVPFRGERLLSTVARSAGASAQTVVADAGVIVGTTPQIADIGSLALDMFVPGAFGVRLQMNQATPGITVKVPCSVQNGPIPAGESIAVSLTILGRVIRA